jgi:hypothetical protein
MVKRSALSRGVVEHTIPGRGPPYKGIKRGAQRPASRCTCELGAACEGGSCTGGGKANVFGALGRKAGSVY